MSKEKTKHQKSTNSPLVITYVEKLLTPHRCPICNGTGLVPNGFYMQTSGNWSTSSTIPEQCRSCGGTGIVQG